MDILNKRLFSPLYRENGLSKHLALCYHSIGDESAQNLHRISNENFSRQLEALKDRGYQFLQSDEFLEKPKLRISQKLATITFDDGYRDLVDHAIPLLESMSIPYTIFVNTRLLDGAIFWRDKVRLIIENGWVEQLRHHLLNDDPELEKIINWQEFYRSSKSNQVNSRRLEVHLDSFLSSRGQSKFDSTLYLTREDIRKFNPELCRIGNHTKNHYRLSSLTREEQAIEISENNIEMEKLNVPLASCFAIPFGENGSFNQETIELLKEFRYNGFFMTNHGMRNLNIPRMNVNPLGMNYSNRILPINESHVL